MGCWTNIPVAPVHVLALEQPGLGIDGTEPLAGPPPSTALPVVLTPLVVVPEPPLPVVPEPDVMLVMPEPVAPLPPAAPLALAEEPVGVVVVVCEPQATKAATASETKGVIASRRERMMGFLSAPIGSKRMYHRRVTTRAWMTALPRRDPSRVDVSTRSTVAFGPMVERTQSTVEDALAGALSEASRAARWDVVAQLARELQARSDRRQLDLPVADD
jgi:hypothetical protein